MVNNEVNILQILIPLINNISVMPLMPVLMSEPIVTSTVQLMIIRPLMPRNN